MTTLIVALFAAGYSAIVLEHTFAVNKSASALLTGVACWTAYVLLGDAKIPTPPIPPSFPNAPAPAHRR